MTSHGQFVLRPYKTRYDGVINGYESCGKCINKMIDENPELDAIMTAIDSYGMAALRITRERGIDVPGKIRSEWPP